MNESELDNKESLTLTSRYRSPSFKQTEVKALLELIRKHREIVLNKAVNGAANHAKDRVWRMIAKELNKLGLGPERSAFVLKTKWENLKRSAKKISKDVMENDCDFNVDDVFKTVMLLNDENKFHELDENINLKSIIGSEEDGVDYKIWASEEENHSAVFGDEMDNKQNITPKKFEISTGFSPHDCRVLLQCVRQEKKVLFSKSSLFKRQLAWKRIADIYNKQSPQKKTSKELSQKFNNLKLMARRINVKGLLKNKKSKYYEQMCDDNTPMLERVKSEPIVDCAADFELDSDDDLVHSEPVHIRDGDRLSFAQDPLNYAHGSSSDSGLGSIPDVKDAARLKLELLNYQMETARLERKRVEDAIKGEQKERELRALEQSLRIRAARLELAAAEAKLPSTHPALNYTQHEELGPL